MSFHLNGVFSSAGMSMEAHHVSLLFLGWSIGFCDSQCCTHQQHCKIPSAHQVPLRGITEALWLGKGLQVFGFMQDSMSKLLNVDWERVDQHFIIPTQIRWQHCQSATFECFYSTCVWCWCFFIACWSCQDIGLLLELSRGKPESVCFTIEMYLNFFLDFMVVSTHQESIVMNITAIWLLNFVQLWERTYVQMSTDADGHCIWYYCFLCSVSCWGR